MGALADELNRLRRGRGIMACDLHERAGPTLRAMAGIDPADSRVDPADSRVDPADSRVDPAGSRVDPAGSREEARRRLLVLLDELSGNLPEDLRLAFSAGLALHPDARQRFLEERMRWLAARLQRDVRTARRRVDEAIRLAEASAGARVLEASDYVSGGWYLARLRTLLRLDGERPTAIEERTVVASEDGLREFVISTSVPRPATADSQDSGIVDGHKQRLELDVVYGGSLAHFEQPSASYFRYFIRLPRPLDRGESQDVGVALTIPGDQPLNPRYTFQPLRRCDDFDLRIRFGSHSTPASIWNIAGLPHGMVHDFAEPDALVLPDTAGDIHLLYQQLRIGLAYGVRWCR